MPMIYNALGLRWVLPTNLTLSAYVLIYSSIVSLIILSSGSYRRLALPALNDTNPETLSLLTAQCLPYLSRNVGVWSLLKVWASFKKYKNAWSCVVLIADLPLTTLG